MYEKLLTYIRENWDNTRRFNPEDTGIKIGMPYPYTVPCIQSKFNDMYYWDTYFANKGLILHDRVQQAMFNCNNMRFLINKFGFMPNGSNYTYQYRSQPPYLSMMVMDVYEKTQDKEWLKACYKDLLKEYKFWMTYRITESGLNRYGSDSPAAHCTNFIERFKRVPYETKGSAEYIAHCFEAECESGWDFSDRFEQRGLDFNPVDLNSNLYIYEKNFEKMEEILCEKDGRSWAELAQNRRRLMNELMWDSETGVFRDYDYVQRRLSRTISAAGFHPYYAGLADEDKKIGASNLLKLLEVDHGITCTPETDKLYFQWGYPNGWAPLQWIAVVGLTNVGLEADARRLCEKYLSMVFANYEQTGHIWEKYNVVTGDLQVVNEYDMPDMMGWSAGIFTAMHNYLYGTV